MKRNLIGKSLFLLFALLLLPMAAMSQTITVKGVVTDNTGQPLPGVNVVVEGTTNGTITDVNGNYSVQASSDATLVFSFIGFESTTEAIQGRTQISVRLQEESLAVGEVVVVGYGQMKRSDVTGSVVSVGDEAIKKAVITSADQVLQGRAAGVQVQQNSGTPGGSSSIRIRGINSLNAYNLERSEAKTDALIDYVKYIDQQNGSPIVDGIGTQMHISTDTDSAGIAIMFTKLAATGKLIRITELDITNGGKSSPTAEQLAAQSDKYKQVLDIYFSIVPREQQYGVCVWSLSDNENENEYWLNGETPNLFDAKYNRKHAYKGFCDGLAGRVIGVEFKS